MRARIRNATAVAWCAALLLAPAGGAITLPDPGVVVDPSAKLLVQVDCADPDGVTLPGLPAGLYAVAIAGICHYDGACPDAFSVQWAVTGCNGDITIPAPCWQVVVLNENCISGGLYGHPGGALNLRYRDYPHHDNHGTFAVALARTG